ncbi:MAG: flagellar basal-body rod modification protein FlgD [Myxococcota bacterium]|jgi:flagellar basal-body rod modification protein FlgD
MDIASVATAGSGASAVGMGREQDMGKEEFLKLLVTQLSQQDPLNPADGAEFVAQLAQFTSLERLVNMEQALGDVALATMANANSQAAGYIGKGVVAKGDTFDFNGGQNEKLGFTLGKDAAKVTITVKDGEGNIVETIQTSGTKGENTFDWQGAKDTGKRGEATAYHPDGTYTFEVQAEDGEGNAVTVPEQTVVTNVSSVKFKDRVPWLVLANGETVGMGDVREFTDATDQ